MKGAHPKEGVLSWTSIHPGCTNFRVVFVCSFPISWPTFFFLFNDCTGVPDGPCRQGKGCAVCLLMQCAVSLALGKGLADIVCLHIYEIVLFY